MDKARFVAQGWELIDRGMRELADLSELSVADIRRGRRLTRWAHELDAYQRGTEPPSTPGDERARDIYEATIDRIEALGDKASARDFGALREAMRGLSDIDGRERRRHTRRQPGGRAAAAEPSDLARRLLAEENGHETSAPSRRAT